MLDAKRVLRIYKRLQIGSLKELEERLASGGVREAFGERVEMHVRQGLDPRPRLLLRKAEQLARIIENYLREIPGVEEVARTGSLRRCQETVGDLGFLVRGGRRTTVFDACQQLGNREEGAGRDRAIFRTAAGYLVTVAWSSQRSWANRLLQETGAAAHLREVQQLSSGSRRPRKATRKTVERSESDVYRSLGLPFIEPELREGRGEVDAAKAGKLPILVDLSDLKGDLHMHTTASDGGNSIEEMVEAARAEGIGISPSPIIPSPSS